MQPAFPVPTAPNILLVEDERLYRLVAIQCLYGYPSDIAIDGASGMARFLQKMPDITFLDIHLPDGNGLDLLKDMKRIAPHAYIIMMTASTSIQDYQMALSLGAAGYITKPFTTQIITDHVKKFQDFRKKNPIPKGFMHFQQEFMLTGATLEKKLHGTLENSCYPNEELMRLSRLLEEMASLAQDAWIPHTTSIRLLKLIAQSKRHIRHLVQHRAG